MKTKLYLTLLTLVSLIAGCKKEYINVSNYSSVSSYYGEPKDSTVFILSPEDSSIVYDTVPIHFYTNKKLKIIRTECHLDFDFLEGFDTIPSEIKFFANNYQKGSIHNYFLRIIVKDGSVFNSNIITLIISKLTKPDLNVVFLSKTSLKLTWTDSSNNETGYHVYRKEGNNDSVLVADLPANSSSFTDNTLDTAKSYSYWIEVFSLQEKMISEPLRVKFELNLYLSYKEFATEECADGKIVLSPDASKAVLTNYFNDQFPVVDLKDGSKTYLTHTGGTKGLAMSHSGEFFVTGGTHGSPDIVKLWNLNTLSLIRNISPSVAVFELMVNKTDERLVVGGEPIKIYNISNGSLVKDFDQGNYFIRSLVFSGDETLILSGGNDDLVKLWNSTSGELLKSYTGHTGHVGSVCFNEDESQIFSGSYEDGTLKIWDKNTAQLVGSMPFEAGIAAIFPRPDGNLIVALLNGKIFIINPGGEQVQEFGESDHVFSIDYNSAKDIIASYENMKIQLYKRIGHWIKI